MSDTVDQLSDNITDASTGQDSDVDSHSVCSGSDSHSGHTSLSGATDKGSLVSSVGHGSLLEVTNTALVATPTLPEPDSKNVTSGNANLTATKGGLLPWGAHKERSPHPSAGPNIDMDIRPGEYVMVSLFADFTIQAEMKIEAVMGESQEKLLSKLLQRGEDAQFDQLLSAFGSVAEHCLPSLLRALFLWYERQMAEVASSEQKKVDPKAKSIINIVSGSTSETIERSEVDIQQERRDLAVEFIFCLVLIEVLRQLSFHPGHEDLVQYIENLAFKHFKYRDGIQSGPNAGNIHIIADLYAEVIGALAQSRFMSVRTRFMQELKELRAKDPSPMTTQSIISLLMGMKFFRVKMVPIEEFEASFQFMQECAQYFLEVKDKDIKHALAGLFVEILVPVAATVKNEVNVPCLKNFVEMLYSQTLDASTKSKHRLALFPLITCLLCVSQKQFFLQNWHCFLAMCLSHLKNRDPKMCRVALEALYRLLWVYMIRIKCESNSATQSRLQSIVNSLFPKGSKGVVPRDTPLNIFVKIIQFIAQERLDFAMREIVFDLLSVGRPIKIILTPERMSIGLRAFLVVTDSLQQKEGEPPMPRSMGVLPSGNTLRVKKTFLNKMLTEDTARSIGMSSYFPHVRRVFVDILRALDAQYGRPLMMTSTQNVNKEPDEMITGERKPRIDLFRTCVAAVPRLIPDGMTGAELVDLLSRLTVHMDEELRALAFQSLQTLVMDFPDWRQDVLWGFTQFLARDVLDTFPQLVDSGLRMLLQLLTTWRASISVNNTNTMRIGKDAENKSVSRDNAATYRTDNQKPEPLSSVLHLVEAFALVMLCNHRLSNRRLSVHILRDVKTLTKTLNCSEDQAAIDVMDQCCSQVLEKCIPLLPAAEKSAIQAVSNIDLQWLADRNASIWTAGLHEDGLNKTGSSFNLNFIDPWSICLFGFLERNRILTHCPTLVSHAWPIVFTRVNALFPVIDPTPVNDNRASLLRSSAAVKKPVNERDIYIHVWKNYITFAFRVVPPVPSPIVRCASPDLSLSSLEGVVETKLSTSLENLVQAQGFVSTGRFTLPLAAIRKQHKRVSSSPDSLSAERNDAKMPGANVSPSALYKLVVPLLRCEVSDVRDAAVLAIGNVNNEALKDVMEELVLYIRDAVDKKQENVRRRRRRDALRLQLVKVFELIAEYGTFGVSSFVLDRDTNSLHPTFLEYMDGARLYLESEPDKHTNSVKEITLHFCSFITKMIKSFSLDTCQTLLKRDLRKNLFMLFATWSGKYGVPFAPVSLQDNDQSHKKCTELQFSALQAMSALLCCGPCIDPEGLEYNEGDFYQWLDNMLNSHEEKVYNLARETVILLLEFNPDVGPLLDWAVDRCYTGNPTVADGCFLALATIFSAKEYPCDHYTAVINVALMNTGCPRPVVRDTALQLLQLLDKRFFGTVGLLAEGDLAEGDKGRSTLDTLLATTYCRSQFYLSSQLAQLHPELTMPMFSEITCRFQTARPEVKQLLLQYLLPWLHNMELVDPNVPPTNLLFYYQLHANEMGRSGGRREGWGSAEATEMVLNNIFYITAKFGDNHPKELEKIWATLCKTWPNNMKVIIRYLIIISGMAPNELLPYAKRVILYLARVEPPRLLDEMMVELQTVETLNCLIERTETPPFYRLTVMRKASSHSDGTGGVAGQSDNNSRNDLGVEKGTIHTKRHSGEDPLKSGTTKTETMKALPDFNSPKSRNTNGANISEDLCTPTTDDASEDLFSMSRAMGIEKLDISIPQPHPLPMPAYGGYFAPLREYLPDTSQPISGFHRCNVAVMLLCDVVVDGIEVDWAIHVPLMLHILFLGMDHTRFLVHQHCKQLLLNLLIVQAQHNDHLMVAHILLNSKTNELALGLPTPQLPVVSHNFTEPDPIFDSYLQGPMPVVSNVETNNTSSANVVSSCVNANSSEDKPKEPTIPPVIVTPEENSSWNGPEIGPNMPIQEVIKSLIDFLATRQNQPLWNYEDITAKVWQIRSAEQIDVFLQHILRVFQDSLPNAHINERWAQTALQLGLSCSSRHYAGRSLQIFRALRVPITSRMLSDILSRLVETVAEQGEDMQGYVTELLLTLEAAVDSLESDFRPLDFMRDFFKSTPNLNNKETALYKRTGGHLMYGDGVTPFPYLNQGGHIRSTSYSVSYNLRKSSGSPATDAKELKGRIGSEIDTRSGSNLSKFCSNLSRSRSAQSLKLLGDSASQDDKMTILAQLFWLSVSLLESDYEHEFLLALRLLARVMHRLPLDRPDARDKVEKLQSQLRWNSFPGVHALLLKGCTHQNIYEPVVALLSQFTPLLDLVVVDPSQSIAFPMNVIALLPYMLLNYEDANELCIRSAENIAQVSIEKSKKLENLGTVMNLYSRRTFCKESFQWTKCVVKYLYDTYSYLSLPMLTFLVEVLEKGPTNLQLPVLNILHCMLHYIDLASAASQPINADLLRVIVKYIEGTHWKESLKILKLVVTRSSSLSAPPTSLHTHWETSVTSVPHPSFSEIEVFSKKELPGRTMDFTFDMSQTPVIGRKILTKPEDNAQAKAVASPRRSCSLSPADTAPFSGWKRPWMSQGRVRECLVNLLTTCGQRVGLPKSPSVIFSQSSDILERQSSMASSTEEMSAANNDLSGGSRRDDATADFGVFKDFDFLEYESESIEGESTDNFNWGVRRRPLSEGEEEQPSLRQMEDSISEQTPVLTIRKRVGAEESSDDEVGSESPLDEIAVAPEFDNSSTGTAGVFPPSSLSLTRTRHDSSARSDTSGSSTGDLGDVTPCNASPGLMNMRPITRSDTVETWSSYVHSTLSQNPTNPLQLFHQLQKLIKSISNATVAITQESCTYLCQSVASNLATVKIMSSRLSSMVDIVTHRILPTHFIWFNTTNLNNQKLLETLKYGMLEVQEHLDTFCDKREQATMYSDSVKTSLKLELLSGQHNDTRHEDYLLDLGKALYKLHFQLLLLIEAANKMISTLNTTLKNIPLKDVTHEVILIKSALTRAMEDTEADGGTPTPVSTATSPAPLTLEDLENSLYELLTNEKWPAAVSLVKHHRGNFNDGDPNLSFEDDIIVILNSYCKKLVQERSDCYVITYQDGDMGDVFVRLFQLSSAVQDLEGMIKDRDQSDASVTSQPKESN